ncbi:ABC transporter permease [Paenibacillus thalictri]|uniref:ABC transporter permease n=2 Tax=Paenibacillus thalictri TaxID=2527873 RepID=A0A4Q9DK73_9BACL|nr:ABC transporter permease [Paenibacillus thalictri]
MLSLIQNENMKIYLRARTWIMIGLIPVILLAFAILMKFVIKGGIDHVLTFASMSTNVSTLVLIFSVIVAGDIVASEFTWGTIKLLLIRPASRSKILLSKYVAVVLFMLGMLVVTLICSYFIGLVFFGASGPTAGNVSFSRILGEYGLKAVDMLMAVTLSFMISSAFRSSSFAIGLSMFLMFMADPFVRILAMMQYGWVKFILFANTNLEVYFFGGKPMLQGMTLGFSVTMLVLYWILFYAVAWLLFTRRDVAG